MGFYVEKCVGCACGLLWVGAMLRVLVVYSICGIVCVSGELPAGDIGMF